MTAVSVCLLLSHGSRVPQAKAAARVRHRPLDVADFYLEILGLVALLGYLGFYLRGRATNRELVDAMYV